MTQRTSTSKEKLKQVMQAAEPGDLLRLAKNIRSTCRQQVADTKLPFDPNALREMDKIIERMESQLN